MINKKKTGKIGFVCLLRSKPVQFKLQLGSKLMNKILAIIAALMITGCSTTQISEHSANQIPQNRVYDPQYVAYEFIEKNKDITAITVLRDSGFLGSGCSHTIYINNIKTFAIRANEFINLKLPAGEHLLRLESGAGICPNISLSQNTNLEVGEHEKYRISIASTGQINFSRIE